MKKNITKHLLFTASVVMLLFSCGPNDSASGEGNIGLYFPVEKIVQQQVDSLKRSSDVWEKTVTNGNKTEEKKLVANEVNWETELALFFDLTPNKKAYVGKFKIDTVEKENENIITYDAPNLKLSMLTIIQNKDDASIRAVYGDLKSSNVFYESTYELSLVPYKAFSITGKQTLAFLNSEETFSIRWIKEETDSSSTL